MWYVRRVSRCGMWGGVSRCGMWGGVSRCGM